MPSFLAESPSPMAPAPGRPDRDAGDGGPDSRRLMEASQAAAQLLSDVQRDIAHHEGWAAHLQSMVGSMTGEERVTQDALVAALRVRIETLCARRARLEADLGRLQRPDLAGSGDRSAMADLARLVETYAGAARSRPGGAASSMPDGSFDVPGQPRAGDGVPRSRRLPPIAEAEELDRPRGRRRRLSGVSILRVAALLGVLALLLFAFGSEPNGVAEPGEDARFMASNGGSRLPQVTATPGAGTPGAGAFPELRFPMPGLPLPGTLQSGPPGTPSALPGLSLPGGIELDRLPEILPQALSAARQAL